jgi:hypothetical protein
MEGKEWIWDNGVIREKTIANYEHTISSAPKKELTEAKLKVWSDFLSKL